MESAPIKPPTKRRRVRRLFRKIFPVLDKRGKNEAGSLKKKESLRFDEAVSKLTGTCYRKNKLDTRAKRWLSSLSKSDPRRQINTFFNTVAEQGAQVDRLSEKSDILIRCFSKASVFTVWRPCSMDAIRKMITGHAVGKGLEIKGKSAKKGRLSGFVPYLQIHSEAHKRQVGTLQKDGRTRIFYETEEARTVVYEKLKSVQQYMLEEVRLAKKTLKKKKNGSLRTSSKVGGSLRTSTRKLVSQSSFPDRLKEASKLKKYLRRVLPSKTFRRKMLPARTKKWRLRHQEDQLEETLRQTSSGECEEVEVSDEEEEERALQKMVWKMDDPSIKLIDTYAPEAYGIEVPDRLLWKAFVTDQPIERTGNMVTGRPSEPAFQDMNNIAIHKSRKKHKENKGIPLVVLWQVGGLHDPLSLVMAYEERGRIRPVVSDFDCFTMGTRGVQYSTPLPQDQQELLDWCVTNAHGVLDQQRDSDGSASWTARWLEVLKANAIKGFQPNVPRFGFGDEKSYEIMEAAVNKLMGQNGAVRHGAECFNYVFPQELDEEFLIISDRLPGKVPWKYVKLGELQDFFIRMIDEGFTFPLNPKWVLCDPGFKRIYDHLHASQHTHVQESLSVWYPPDTGIREKIEEACRDHSQGYITTGNGDDSEMDGAEAMDLAKLQLNRYMVLQRAKSKLRAVMMFKRMARNCNTTSDTTSLDGSETVYQEASEKEETEYFSSRQDDDDLFVSSSSW